MEAWAWVSSQALRFPVFIFCARLKPRANQARARAVTPGRWRYSWVLRVQAFHRTCSSQENLAVAAGILMYDVVTKPEGQT